MPLIGILILTIELYFVIHAYKTGRANPWMWLILMFPVIGCVLYFFLEMLPELQRTPAAKSAAAQVLKTIDPQRDLKRLAKNLELTDNTENKVKLAQECTQAGLFDEAIDLYRSALNGIYQTDPNILLNLAFTLFQKGDYVATQKTLDDLIAANPEFKSQEGHLLYARTLESLQNHDKALEEYKVLASYYSGYEAKCRYALLLKKLGYTEKATVLFNDILERASNMPKNYRKLQKQWIDIAKQQIS